MFSAAFVTSLTVAQSIGMTVPATRTGEESSTARAVLTSSVPPTAVVLPDIPVQPAGHRPGACARAKSSPAMRPGREVPPEVFRVT